MKKLCSGLLALLFVLSLTSPALAAEGKVSYDGNAREFIFAPGSEYSPTDLFPDFKGVMPGDTLTQKITVKNDASRQVKVKIYLRSLGAQEASADFLSQLSLKVQKSEGNEMPYMFDAAAGETAQLTDWVSLGTLYSGGAVDLNVILEVPATLDNAWQSQIGYLDWEFKVEEYPIESGDPKPPKTGDSSNVALWIALMVISLAVLIFLTAGKGKSRRNGKTDRTDAADRP